MKKSPFSKYFHSRWQTEPQLVSLIHGVNVWCTFQPCTQTETKHSIITGALPALDSSHSGFWCMSTNELKTDEWTNWTYIIFFCFLLEWSLCNNAVTEHHTPGHIVAFGGKWLKRNQYFSITRHWRHSHMWKAIEINNSGSYSSWLLLPSFHFSTPVWVKGMWTCENGSLNEKLHERRDVVSQGHGTIQM